MRIKETEAAIKGISLQAAWTVYVFAVAIVTNITSLPGWGETLTLGKAMREAQENSEEASILEEQIKRSEAVKRQAWAEAFPQISAYGTAGRGSTPFDPAAMGFDGGGGAPPAIINPTMNRYAYGVEGRQALFSFGRLGQVLKVAGILDKSIRTTVERSRQELNLSTMDAYFGAILARSRLESVRSSIQRQRELVSVLERNFELGGGTRADLLLARSAVSALESDRIRSERDVETATLRLNSLLGRPLNSTLQLDTTVDLSWAHDTVAVNSGADDVVAARAQEEALKNRSDLQALRLRREVLEGQAKYMRMLYRPSLGAQGKFGILAYQTDQLTDWKNREWQVGLGLNWNLFDGNGLRAQAAQISSDARVLGYQEKQLAEATRIEIESALRDREASAASLEAARESFEASKEARQLLAEEFAMGQGRLADLLSAEASLQQSEVGMLNARYQRIRALASLKLAVGKNLLDPEEK